jgi:recombinational DNA repair ATPase RecF
MRLITVTLKSYRVHDNTSVTFDAARTVVGGPNEAGKSTLVEAVHHALFLRSRVTGAVQKAMLSELHPGHPTVELRFESGGREYEIVKVFAGGPSASTTFKEVPASEGRGGAGGGAAAGSRTLRDEEAEQKIHEILRAEDVGGGRGVESRIRSQWAHLWVWQGAATDDPLAHANADRHGELLRERLAQVEGGGVLESALDAAVARDIAARHVETFNEKGKVRNGSGLDLATKDLGRAEADLAAAAAAIESLEVAVRTIDSTTATIATSDAQLLEARREMEDVRSRQLRAAELSVRLAREEAAAAAAETAHAEAVQADQEIAACLREIAERDVRMAPAEKALVDLETEELACGTKCDAAAREMADAGRRQTAAAASFGLLDLHGWHERLLLEREGLAGRCARIAEQQDRVRALDLELAKVPAITDAEVAELSRLDRARESAEATLRAIATRVEVTAAASPVTLGGAELTAGEPVTITAAAELVVGGPSGPATVKITPGGGRSLAEATQRFEEARTAIDAALASRGLDSVEAARVARARRLSLEADIHATRVAIAGLGGDEALASLATRDAEIEKVATDIRRRSAGELVRPESLAAAQAAAAQAERDLTAAGEAVAAASAMVTTARDRLDAVMKKRQKAAEQLRVNRTEVESLQARAALLLERHGADRADTIAALERARREAAERLAASRRELARLAPDALELDRQRLERTLANLQAAKQDAETRRQFARAKLELEGTTDPRDDLARTAARRRLAAAEQARVSREADAVRLLATLFAEKKRDVESQFVAPLTNRVRDYLERLYGEGTAVCVGYEGGRFSRLTLSRRGVGDATFEFSQLSAGAKEQVAAAFRLAMAEVLAEGYGGALPIVFDDAFVNSDADRQRALQRLLDLGASRGLQIIVLSCRPENYTRLGAAVVMLDNARKSARGTV